MSPLGLPLLATYPNAGPLVCSHDLRQPRLTPHAQASGARAQPVDAGFRGPTSCCTEPQLMVCDHLSLPASLYQPQRPSATFACFPTARAGVGFQSPPPPGRKVRCDTPFPRLDRLAGLGTPPRRLPFPGSCRPCQVSRAPRIRSSCRPRSKWASRTGVLGPRPWAPPLPRARSAAQARAAGQPCGVLARSEPASWPAPRPGPRNPT